MIPGFSAIFWAWLVDMSLIGWRIFVWGRNGIVSISFFFLSVWIRNGNNVVFHFWVLIIPEEKCKIRMRLDCHNWFSRCNCKFEKTNIPFFFPFGCVSPLLGNELRDCLHWVQGFLLCNLFLLVFGSILTDHLFILSLLGYPIFGNLHLITFSASLELKPLVGSFTLHQDSWA